MEIYLRRQLHLSFIRIVIFRIWSPFYEQSHRPQLRSFFPKYSLIIFEVRHEFGASGNLGGLDRFKGRGEEFRHQPVKFSVDVCCSAFPSYESFRMTPDQPTSAYHATRAGRRTICSAGFLENHRWTNLADCVRDCILLNVRSSK